MYWIYSPKNETNEAKEATDNNEKKRNQILDTPEDYDDDFDKKLDENENKESKDQPKEASEEKGDDKEKNSIMDKLRNLFSKKENNDDKGESKEESDKKDDGSHIDAAKAFRESYKVDNSNNQVEKNAQTNMDTKRTQNEGESGEDNTADEARTPGGDAWERRFGRIEGEDQKTKDDDQER